MGRGIGPAKEPGDSEARLRQLGLSMKCKDGASQAASPPNRPVLWPDHNRNALKSESDRAFTSQHSTLVDFAAEGEELLEATSNRDAQTKGNRERSERIVSENAAHVVVRRFDRG